MNARTGELTPPGIRACAAPKMAWEWLVFKAGAVTGTDAKGLMQTVQHPDSGTTGSVCCVS
ncbi:hypothetical protein SynRS9907_00650 [Synechococcus sp. RS9907]|nr:hypothetical protein SynRS9907_00650 [Synechococcus sp. RS9907]